MGKLAIFGLQQEAVVVEPVERWARILKDRPVVSEIAAFGGVVTRGASIFVPAESLYRLTAYLREMGLTWRYDPSYATEQAIAETGNPMTLVNRILFNPEEAYSWEDRDPYRWVPDAKGIDAAVDREDRLTPDLVDDRAFHESVRTVVAMEKSFPDANPEVPTTGAQYNDPETDEDTAEKSDAGTVSTAPDFNPCPVYFRGFCRVDGRPCLYNKVTYQDCPKYPIGLKMQVELMAIKPGDEDEKYSGTGPLGNA